MAHKTFISYKFSEATALRDKIIEALGDDASYYTGETSDSPDLTDYKTETIRDKLKDMIYGTTVTIVIISPNMKESQWIDWEIEYSLKEIKRGDITSTTNGVVGVVMKYNGDYSWIKTSSKKSDGCITTITDNTYLFDIISNNRFNQNPVKYACSTCKSVDALAGSYIALINSDEFLADPNYYINNAFDKSRNSSNYNIQKER